MSPGKECEPSLWWLCFKTKYTTMLVFSASRGGGPCCTAAAVGCAVPIIPGASLGTHLGYVFDATAGVTQGEVQAFNASTYHATMVQQIHPSSCSYSRPCAFHLQVDRDLFSLRRDSNPHPRESDGYEVTNWTTRATSKVFETTAYIRKCFSARAGSILYLVVLVRGDYGVRVLQLTQRVDVLHLLESADSAGARGLATS